MSSPYTLRPVEAGDLPFLWDMLYEAAAVDATMRAIGREQALAMPVVQKYLAGWGREGDSGWIAVNEQQQPLGAAWYRLFPAESPGYGFISESIPELTIGVHERARGLGVGGALLQALLRSAREQGWSALSLSVDRRNPALRLYERHGFRDAGVSQPQDSSVTLVAHFSTER
ncbi:N-acetyltransferase [Dictyobacter sp. S3.2.2.5]|uniref:N-acetyltransferase n=1 Tax=Dictyobacter halimunensis TaxID=3026934 RepID=A0ABQ6G5N7_9CHLR|nr:N-acetyltransferase [Dictyobacter sp. S3.2.2.5]